MIGRFELWLRNLRRRLSRSEWAARQLRQPVCEQSGTQAGLVLIHLEAVSLDQMQEALAQTGAPFLKRLVEIENYQLQPMIGCDGAAIEDEAQLFYGIRDRLSPAPAAGIRIGRDAAIELEAMLSQQRQGLLQGGSQYGGILTGGAGECHFSVVRPGWNSVFAADSRWRRVGVLLIHAPMFVRAGLRAILAAFAALGKRFLHRDIVAGSETGASFSGVRDSSFHRDLAVAGAAIDAARGLPIVHVNLNGPSATAGGGLCGVDRAVRSIWSAARRSARRDYEVWLYSTCKTTPFALLPIDAPLARPAGSAASLLDVREAALHVLGRAPLPAAARPAARHRTTTARVMTYNVHSCLGMDGRLSPARIARVIARYAPDVVALQELDVGRIRSGAVDQAHEIARELDMEFHFYPALAMEEELYGDAILGRYPMRLRRAAALPGLDSRPTIEPRGALWVTLDVEGREVQFLNTHFGLVGAERLRQAEALLSSDWLSHPDCRGPTIVCGDFNALPRSAVCRRLCERLVDAQHSLNGHRPKHTFFGRYPIGRIDHIFVSREIEVIGVEVPRNDLTRRASDHLPLVVELRVR